jgi:signal transduction histidine kinase
MKHGAYDFLPKPFTPDELRFIVRRGLERRRYIIETESLRREKEMMRKNFVSLVSHELRSPLAAVQQNLMVILGGLSGDLPEDTKAVLLRMSHRIKGLIALINDWLDLSRIESGEMTVHMKQVHLPEILNEVVDLVLPLADENKVDIDWHPPTDFPTILGNRETLQMLFTNLVHNAIKYNKKKGLVVITLENTDHHAKVTVKDTGIGIPQEKLLMIFEQFYRAKEGKRVEGSGLGLSIAKKVVEAHQGTIDVESEVGKGTVFTVWLP